MIANLGNRRGRNLGLAAFALMMMLGVLAMPMLTMASTFTAGFTVEHAGERIENDLYVAAFRTTITADVAGDVSLAVVTGTLDSTVGGSVHVIGGNITIRGDINGTLYIAAGVTRLEGAVGGNVVVTGGRLELRDGARVGGDLMVFGAQAEVDGDVQGKLYGSVLLYEQDGAVSGNVDIQADRIDLGDGATIGDDFRYQSPDDADIHVNAQIGGTETRTNATPWSGIGPGGLGAFNNLMRLVWSMLVGTALIAIAPRMFYRVSHHAAKTVASGIWGAIGLVVIPILAVSALLSVFLIPVGLIMIVLFSLGLYLSQVVVGLTIGRAILPRRWRDGSRGYLLLALALGLLIIGTLRIAPIPFLNVITVVLVTIWGFGALLMLLKDLTSSKAREEMQRGY